MKHLALFNPVYQAHVEAFSAYLHTHGYAATTLKSLPRHLREFFYYLEQQDREDLAQISKGQLQGFFDYLAARPARRKDCAGLALAYQAKYRQALRLFARYFEEVKQIGLAWELPLIEEGKRTVTVLSPTQIQALYAACAPGRLGLRDRAMLALSCPEIGLHNKN